MPCDRVLLDDMVLYCATADELGEDGEIVDVSGPGVPMHLRSQLGLPVQLRLEYPGQTVTGWYVFEQILEWLDDSGVTMRFTKLCEEEDLED